MNSLNKKAQKSISAILATVCGAASIVTVASVAPSPALASRNLFSCSAEGLIVQVRRLRNGTFRYEAYNIPTNMRRPDLVLNNGTVRRDLKGDTYYSFTNGTYRYVAIQDQGYGKVIVYNNNRVIAKKYCGDV
ncbi:MAG: hypothetical protein KME64_29390 [Scytonematopsis contorta HA4267-MV1]|jgi:hypothetical protein|nr:hypothetical protein [Scytonematopsis contorta HA4267-MV1]